MKINGIVLLMVCLIVHATGMAVIRLPQLISHGMRHAMADNPQGTNLYNKDGLPASTFRVKMLSEKKEKRVK